MRLLKVMLAVWVGTVVAVSHVAVAGAFISGTSGQLILLSSAPPSVQLNALESKASVFAFDEQQGTVLASKLIVDIVNPGTYGSFAAAKNTIPAGTRIDSHLIHSDITPWPNTVRRAGSVTFPGNVLAVIDSVRNLAASDYLGAPGTLYSGKKPNRGLDSTQDSLTLSADRRTISFNIQTNAMDEFRVITDHVNKLVTTISDAGFDPVQTDNNVSYLLTVTNTGPTPEPDVHVTDQFPGATLVSANALDGCTGTTSVTCGLGDLGAGASGLATIVVQAPSTVPAGGTITNSAGATNEYPAVTEDTTVVSPVLTTDITGDAPDPVTAGNDVQYTVKVTNDGLGTVAEAHALDDLPPGTTFVSANAPFPFTCSGTAPVDCTLGALAPGEFAVAHVVVTSPATVPAGGTITDSATASPGDSNNTDTEDTTVVEPTPGESRGFVSPGDSLAIDSPNPAELTLPDTGDGAPVIITQEDGSFCNGPCVGPATTISSFPGYEDPTQPIHLTLTYNFPDSAHSLQDAVNMYNSTIYKSDDAHPSGVAVPPCTTVDIAIPHPCVNGHTIVENPVHSGNYIVTFDIIYLSGDPRFGGR